MNANEQKVERLKKKKKKTLQQSTLSRYYTISPLTILCTKQGSEELLQYKPLTAVPFFPSNGIDLICPVILHRRIRGSFHFGEDVVFVGYTAAEALRYGCPRLTL